MVKRKHPFVIKPGEDGYFVATVPSLRGCISQGKTRKEAEKNIKEAISLYLECVKNDKTPPRYKRRMVEMRA